MGSLIHVRSAFDDILHPRCAPSFARSLEQWMGNLSTAVSTLPPAAHVNTCMGKSVEWQDLVNQLEMIKSSNPHRSVSRLTLGYKIKIGSLESLVSASGNLIIHLDLTYSKGAKNLDFKAMAKQLPNLKGLAVSNIYIYILLL